MEYFLVTFFLLVTSCRMTVNGQNDDKYKITRGPAGDDVIDPGGDSSDIDIVFKDPRIFNWQAFDDLFPKRRGDAYLYNAPKYFMTLLTLFHKHNGDWQPPPILSLQPNPLAQLGNECSRPIDDNVTLSDMLDMYVGGYISTEDMFSGSGRMTDFVNLVSCTAPGFMPLLTCDIELRDLGVGETVPEPNPNPPPPMMRRGLCRCSRENLFSRWTPFAYNELVREVSGGAPGVASPLEPIGCLGLVGAHCDILNNVTCADGLECDNGTCAGLLGSLARGYGGAITYTDAELTAAIKVTKLKSLKEIESYLIRTSNSRGVIGRDCDPKYWDWATLSLVPFIKMFNTTNPGYERGINLSKFQEDVTEKSIAQLRLYHLPSIYRELGWLRKEYVNESNFDYLNAMAEYYDSGESCLNEFPRVTCVQKPSDPQRGLCQCSTGFQSAIFNYKQQGDQCVGGIGAVCTTVRGSGDHNCEQGLICGSVLGEVDDPDAPGNQQRQGPLSHYEIKICQKPKGIGDEKVTTGGNKKPNPTNHGLTTIKSVHNLSTLTLISIIISKLQL